LLGIAGVGKSILSSSVLAMPYEKRNNFESLSYEISNIPGHSHIIESDPEYIEILFPMAKYHWWWCLRLESPVAELGSRAEPPRSAPSFV
jgi:hypothetical protein